MTPADPVSAGDAIPRDSQVIEVRVAELRQLFNAIDPSPFRERDLDPRAEEFIVEWSRDLPADAPLALVVHLERAAGRGDEPIALRDAIHEFFGQRVAGSQRALRALFRRGRISLAIGLAFLASSIAVGDGIAAYFREAPWAEVVRESLLIGGWVAMWRPLEVFLYDWWPIRAETRLFARLSTMPVRIVYKPDAAHQAWRSDWPAAPVAPGNLAARGRSMPSPDNEHRHTAAEEQRIREASLDETLEGSFPASDPLSSDPNPDDHSAGDGEVRRDDA